MKVLIVSLIFAGLAFAQGTSNPINVKIAADPGGEAITVITHYTSGNPDYICRAKSQQQDVSTITVSAISNANTGVMTATSHGFYYATGTTQKLVVFISGLTGNWTPLNGFHVLTPADANSLTTDVDTTTFGAVTGTPAVSTRAPRATAKVWSVQVIVYDTTTTPANPVIQAWAALATGASLVDLKGGSTAYAFACAMPAAYE